MTSPLMANACTAAAQMPKIWAIHPKKKPHIAAGLLSIEEWEMLSLSYSEPL